MTVRVSFRYPDAWVPLDLEDIEAGSVVAAQTVLGRFEQPVERADAARLERTFAATAQLMVEAEAANGFVLVPDPPALGILGALIVRWSPAVGDDAVADLVRETVEQLMVLDEPDVSELQTALGAGTRCIVRYARVPEQLEVGRRRRAAATTVVELMRWVWRVEDPTGDDIVVSVTSMTEQLEVTPLLRRLVDEFATGISLDV